MEINSVEEILLYVFSENVDTFRDVEARNRITDYIVTLKEEEGFEKLNYSLFVKDSEKVAWQNKAYFYKVFYDEIDYVMEKYQVTQNEIDFLCRLGKYLKWELNLLVDDEDIPLNQKELAEKLHMSVRNLQNYIYALQEKKLIINVKKSKYCFYFINPHILFTGKEINMAIPKLFEIIGYEPSSSCRSNRRKKVTKRGNIKG